MAPSIFAIKLNHAVGSVIAGILFSIGTWVFIDGVVYGSVNDLSLPWYCYFPAVCVSLFLIMINLVSLDYMNAQEGIFENMGSVKLKMIIWLFFWTALSFGCIVGGVVIMIVLYSTSWMGWAIAIQPPCVLISAYIWLFARKSDTNEDSFGGM